MSEKNYYIENLCFSVPLQRLRKTPKVDFEFVPNCMKELSAIDRVQHEAGAVSPSVEGKEDTLWYMHQDQEDNIMVLHGTRIIELYTQSMGR